MYKINFNRILILRPIRQKFQELKLISRGSHYMKIITNFMIWWFPLAQRWKKIWSSSQKSLSSKSRSSSDLTKTCRNEHLKLRYHLLSLRCAPIPKINTSKSTSKRLMQLSVSTGAKSKITSRKSTK